MNEENNQFLNKLSQVKSVVPDVRRLEKIHNNVRIANLNVDYRWININYLHLITLTGKRDLTLLYISSLGRLELPVK
jgi:hypothetical protein